MAIGDLVPRRRPGIPAARSGSSNPLSAFHEEMNRLFDQFWREFDVPGFASGGLGWPSIELAETDQEMKVTAELPGVEDKDVEVLLDNGVLCIRGEKRGETQDSARRLSERYYGRFERRIPLDAEIERDKVSASFKQGVLTVTLPKSVQSAQNSRRIDIAH